MDSTIDTPIILTDSFATKCAEACVNVIVSRAKLQKKAAPAPAPATPAPTATTKLLKKGSSGDEVRRLQNLLNLFGYNCGDADGSFGAKTETAVMAFQKAMKLTQDGKFGKDSYNAMKRALTSTKLIFKKGSKGESVRALQNILNNYNKNKINADASYGAKTEAAVKEYQKSRGLSQDGKAGPKTIGTFVDYLVL
jgi:peptidoglycan hydrolase-like protein with peptidoglycan-binding domain